jgi:hypothetical protein
LIEALLVGVSKNINALATVPPQELQARYQRLATDQEFSDAALREGLSKRPRVVARLAAAVRIFSGN